MLPVEVVYCDVLIDDLSAGARQQLPVVCAILLCHEARIILPRLETVAYHVEQLLALLLLWRHLLHVRGHEAVLVRDDYRIGHVEPVLLVQFRTSVLTLPVRAYALIDDLIRRVVRLHHQRRVVELGAPVCNQFSILAAVAKVLRHVHLAGDPLLNIPLIVLGGIGGDICLDLCIILCHREVSLARRLLH